MQRVDDTIQRSDILARAGVFLPPSSAVLFSAVACLLLTALTAFSQSSPLTAELVTERTDVFVAEPFEVQVRVSGTTAIAQPDLSAVRDFEVQFRGATPNQSTQVSIINGRMTRRSEETVTLSYLFTAKREGRLVIPALTFVAGRRTVRTRAVSIQARKPSQSTDDGAFEMVLPKKACYVGEPIRVRWTVFLPQETRSIEFHVPLVQRPEFDFPAQDQAIDPAKRDRYRKLTLGPKHEVLGLLAAGTRKGRQCTTLSFDFVMIPRTPGEFELPRSTATCQVAAGSERQRQSSPIDSFFNRRRERMRRTVIASDAPKLTVQELPAEGRPASFSGYVGRLNVAVRAEPTVANVGDPIELQIFISGSAYLDYVECPNFETQPDVVNNFRVSDGDTPGEIQGNVKVFKRILRATNPDVAAIPPIEMAYFDTQKGKYETAMSQVIPLTIKATKVVTAMDAEGAAPVSPAGKALRAWSKGIAHNYEDAGVLVNQQAGIDVWLGSTGWLALFGVPPLSWAALFIATGAMRKRKADPKALAARKAGRICLGKLKRIPPDDADGLEKLIEAMRAFFGAKLGVPGGALTFADVQNTLEERGVSEDTLGEIRVVFDACEAGRYAGGYDASSLGELVQAGTRAVKRVDKTLRGAV